MHSVQAGQQQTVLLVWVSWFGVAQINVHGIRCGLAAAAGLGWAIMGVRQGSLNVCRTSYRRALDPLDCLAERMHRYLLGMVVG